MFLLRQPIQPITAKFIAVLSFCIFFALAVDTAYQKSPTNDEPMHLTRSITLLQTGDFRLQFEHTPLGHWLLGIFIWKQPDVQSLFHWSSGDRLKIAHELIWESDQNVDQLIWLGRFPLILTGVLLGAFMARWAAQWQGYPAMIVTMILFSVSPNLLASATLATTDLVTATTFFVTSYALWRFRQRPTRWRWVVTAVTTGLALASKLTSVLLIPYVMFFSYRSWQREKPIWQLLLRYLGLFIIAGGVLWSFYLFEIGTSTFFPWPLPAPTYWKSLGEVLAHVEAGHKYFFLGNVSIEGNWFYFPVVFLIKTPLMEMFLSGVAFIVLLQKKNKSQWETAAFLLFPSLLLLAISITSKLNLGYRHILPIVPPLLTLAGVSISFFYTRPIFRAFVIIGLTWNLMTGLYRHPHHLAYFNELVGGSGQGYRYVGDSNLDWGQDLKLLAEEVTRTPATWYISYAGVGDPGYYGLSEESLLDQLPGSSSFNLANPSTGYYAISVNNLQGVTSDKDRYDWFRHQNPIEKLGFSIFIYRVNQQPGEWVAHCQDPLPLLSPSVAEQIVGQKELRHLVFDCYQSWVLPNHGSPGWIILPQAETWWFKQLLPPEVTDQLSLVYRHSATHEQPSYEVYYWSGQVNVGQTLTSDGQMVIVDTTPLLLPVSTGLASLHSYQVKGNEWYTLWQVETQTDEPLSIQAHLYMNDSLSQVADSLGYSSEQWQAGDWFVQRHKFPVFEGKQFMQTGLYNYLTLTPIGPIIRLTNTPE